MRFVRSLALLALAACAGDPPGITSALPAPEVGPRMRLDARGGVAAITDPDSPLYGAAVVVPAGALSEATTIRIRRGRLPDASNHAGAGEVLELLPEGTTFLEPVTVVLPVPDTAPLASLEPRVWNEASERWETVGTSSAQYLLEDLELEGELVFQTTHFSRYRAVFRDTRTLGLRATEGNPRVRVVARGFATDVVPPGEPPLPARVGTERVERELLPGDYVVEADFGDGPRCARVDLTSSGAELALSPSMSSCEAPTPTLTATPITVKIGEDVTLEASALSGSATNLDWFLNFSRGGQLMGGGRSGVMSTGDRLTWTYRPTSRGTHIVYFTVYEAGAGPEALFGEAALTIEVTNANRPPKITRLDADRRTVGPGGHDLSEGGPPGFVTATAEPPTDDDRTPGATVITVVATDPDEGDVLETIWDHSLPGNFYAYAPPLNPLLRRDDLTGRVILNESPSTRSPYGGTSIVYLAPDCDFVVGNRFMRGMQPNFPLGFWVQMRVLVTDAPSNPNRPRVARSWAHVQVVPPSLRPRHHGPTCRVDEPDGGIPDGGVRDSGGGVVGGCDQPSDDSCTTFFSGGGFESVCRDTGGTWRSGVACDETGAVGACNLGMQEVVFYPPGVASELQSNCSSAGGTWRDIGGGEPGYLLINITNFGAAHGYWAVRREDSLDPVPALRSLACGGTSDTPWEYDVVAGPYPTADEAAAQLCPRVRGFFLAPLAPPECVSVLLDGDMWPDDAGGRDRVIETVCEPML